MDATVRLLVAGETFVAEVERSADRLLVDAGRPAGIRQRRCRR
jgi:hypothetical protein